MLYFNCSIIVAVSVRPQCLTTLPFSNRRMSKTWILKALPFALMPMKSALNVPVARGRFVVDETGGAESVDQRNDNFNFASLPPVSLLLPVLPHKPVAIE